MFFWLVGMFFGVFVLDVFGWLFGVWFIGDDVVLVFCWWFLIGS